MFCTQHFTCARLLHFTPLFFSFYSSKLNSVEQYPLSCGHPIGWHLMGDNLPCGRCKYWTIGVTPEFRECTICRDLHRLVSLIVSGDIPSHLQSELQSLVTDFDLAVDRLVYPTQPGTTLNSWLDARNIRTFQGSSTAPSGDRVVSLAPRGSVGAVTSGGTSGWVPSLRTSAKSKASQSAPVVEKTSSSPVTGGASSSVKQRRDRGPRSPSPQSKREEKIFKGTDSKSVRRESPVDSKREKATGHRSSGARSAKAERGRSPVSPYKYQKGDSQSTDFSQSEIEPELRPGEKLTRGLKRTVYKGILEGRKIPFPPQTAPPRSLRQRSRDGRKESRKQRGDSRTSHRERSPQTATKTPAPGQGKHFGKNKGRKKREKTAAFKERHQGPDHRLDRSHRRHHCSSSDEQSQDAQEARRSPAREQAKSKQK